LCVFYLSRSKASPWQKILSQFSLHLEKGFCKVNSGHPQVEQSLTNFLEVCKRRFPSAIVNGFGRWAVCSFCAGKPQAVTALVNLITLVADREIAEQLAKGPCGRQHCCYVHELNDLLPPPVCRTVPDAYDPEEARRERRAQRVALQQGTSVA
jgi:hypothetical protein